MKSHRRFAEDGISLIETVVVVAIFLSLISLIIVNLLNFRSSASVNTSLYTFITDLKNQQIKAMTGDTEGRGIPDTYSIYIEPTRYTLFHGVNYSFSDPTNFVVSAPSDYQLTTSFGSNKIIFASGSGEINSFVSGQNSIIFTNISTGQQKTIQINKYGVVVSIN